MREKRNFAERTKVLPTNEAKKKYFLVYEGSDTEDIYFEAINNHKMEIGINPLIELIPLVRSYSEEGWSNPKKIVDCVIDNLEQAKTGILSYETLLNYLMEYMQEEKMISNNRKQAADIWKLLKRICLEKMSVHLEQDVEDRKAACIEILSYLKSYIDVECALEDISRVIEGREITYAEGFDKICFIFDRDRNSFVAKPENNQYEYVLNKCIENKFNLYISNPCFEFWLLLHFDEVLSLDKQRLLENPKMNAKGRRYTEQELRNVLRGYSKSGYNAEILIENVDKAVENEKLFCEDINRLEYEIGCNLGLLIQELKSE